MTQKEEIELLKAKIRALELEIEVLKRKQRQIIYIPGAYTPYPTYPNPLMPTVWYETNQCNSDIQYSNSIQ